jgi:lipid-binding SYLF domain-containing protein
MHDGTRIVRAGQRLAGVFALLAMLVLNHAAAEAWQPAAGDRLQERAANAIDRVRAEVERSHPYFDDAYAIAVWPGITRIAAGFGGAYGKGVVIEQGKAVGTVKYWQFSSGIQAGAKNFALVIFFRDREALEGLKQNKAQFTGQAGVDVLTFGAAGTPAYNEGVALIPLTNLGLMAEFSAAGVWFRYKPNGE